MVQSALFVQTALHLSFGKFMMFSDTQQAQFIFVAQQFNFNTCYEAVITRVLFK
jgi:hypothetical protein